MKKILLLLFGIAYTTFALSGMKMRMDDNTAIKEFATQKIDLKIKTFYNQRFQLHYVKVGSDTLPTLFFVHGSPGRFTHTRQQLPD